MLDMRYTDRKTNTHIHPDGKLRLQIHVIVGGNPGEHVISTHKTHRKPNTHVSRWILWMLHSWGNKTGHGQTQRVAWYSQNITLHRESSFYIISFFSLVIFGATVFEGQDICTLCRAHLGDRFPRCLFRDWKRIADFSFMLCKLSHSVSNHLCVA